MTPVFETLIKRLRTDNRLMLTIVLGGLLCFVPILHFFAFGYLYRYAKQARRRGDFSLPSWSAWDRLFMDGLRFFALWLLCLGVPLLLAMLVGALMNTLLFGFAAPIAYLLFSVTTLLGPIWFCAMLYRYQERERWADLRLTSLPVGEMKALVPQLLVPLLSAAGLLVLAAPLYGFALFIGHLVIIPCAQVYLSGRARGLV